ncbi:MAG: hypothetical protein JWQ37_658 [Blastococcus sp.]|nr:hypothetical protein [Blastococcus sp.]
MDAEPGAMNRWNRGADSVPPAPRGTQFVRLRPTPSEPAGSAARHDQLAVLHDTTVPSVKINTHVPGYLNRHSLDPVLFTVASAHLLAMEAHEGQVVEQGGDYYLHRLVPLADAARPYGARAEMAAVLHRIIEHTRDHPDVTGRYDADRLRALEVPEEVVRAIEAVTRRPGERYLGGLIQRSAADRLGRLIALLDNKCDLDQTVDLARADPDKARILREGRYLPARRILLKAEAADLQRILA